MNEPLVAARDNVGEDAADMRHLREAPEHDVSHAPKLDARLEGVRLLARTMEHEVNNALGPALVCAELLSEVEGLPAEAHVLAATIRASVEKAANIVRVAKRLDGITERHWPGLETTLDFSKHIA